MHFLHYKKILISGLLGGLLFAVFLPKPAHADVFSSLSSFFSPSETALADFDTYDSGKNSQNISLLEAGSLPIQPKKSQGAEIGLVGGTSLLSEAGPQGTLADIEDYAHNSQISTYTVKEGDTLSEIAEFFHVSQNTITWANDIKKGVIFEGQKLVILPVSGIQYTVGENDTLASIAKKYKIDVRDIAEFNDIATTAQLAIGTDIVIPDGESLTDATGHNVSSVTGKKPKVRGTDAPSYDGYYMRPIAGGYKSQKLHGYNAIDLATSEGTLVYASAGGTILVAKSQGWNTGYGKYIVIQHPNKTQTLYAHLSKISIESGTVVKKGQTIALTGNTGNSTGPHLHFEVRGAKNPF